jgi:type IV pilus assembly protein PilB
MRTKATGILLYEKGLVAADKLYQALEIQKTSKKKIGEILVEMGCVDEKELTKVLAEKLHVDFLDLEEYKVNKDAVWVVPYETAVQYTVIPLDISNGVMRLATNDPMNFPVIEEIQVISGYPIRTVFATKTAILNAIENNYQSAGYQANEALEDVNSEFGEAEQVAEGNEILDAPIVKYINTIIQQAVHIGASDIHIEPMKSVTRVRMRIDGELHSESEIKSSAHASIITRLKIISGMDIAERRIPQDGRAEFKVDNKSVDLRLSCAPTVLGEKMVIRILGNTGLYTIDELGLSDHNREMLDEILQTSYGMLLVCGPTGSGKSTTVYAILNSLNDPTVNVSTIEDPVEYHIEGISQVQVNNKTGLTFASGLRSFLRQDPDIMMVGEIRDGETATIATRAAITGHLVISTIHTNDAASTTARLVNMGVDPFMVSASMIGVISQRLVKRLCPNCKEAYTSTEREMKLLGLTEPVTLYRKKGCVHCNDTGHRGRRAVHEIIRVSSDIRRLIDEEKPSEEIKETAIREGTISMQDGCKELVLEGDVSVEEMLRATYIIN